VDTLTSSQRSARMALVRGCNTKPELCVRKLLRDMGYYYRLHCKSLPGKPDIVFGKRRKIIFIHGCFWHRHDDPNCRLVRLPKSRREFWETKLTANAKRDVQNHTALVNAGWKVMVVWECELAYREQVGNKVRQFLEG
jgi:DNA mismatch endonuclease, patch repair protein